MNLTINFVWIGDKRLGWLECFVIYAWRLWGCEVNIFTHYPNSDRTHDHESLGLPPNVVNVFDLPTVVAHGERLPGTREVLGVWFHTHMPEWNEGGQRLTFNMADLCKSYLAATTRGIVMDLKIGPSPHIKRYVDSGIFSSTFIGCRRVGTIENQLMGSMSDDDTQRTTYGIGFETALFQKNMVTDLTGNPFGEWFPQATAAHNRAMGAGKFALAQGLKGAWFDIGKYGRNAHGETLRIFDAHFEGIAREEDFGAVRIFKREDDQSNKFGGVRTTDDDREKMQSLTFRELAQHSTISGPIDVEAPGMPPVEDMLSLLRLTRKR